MEARTQNPGAGHPLASLTPSPRCPHFGICGGCSHQDISYEEELRRKSESLRRLLGRDVPLHASPQPFHYRTRMDYIYTGDALGLRERGSRDRAVDITECLLISPRALKVHQKVRGLLRELRIPPYSMHSHQGHLRYVSIRESPGTGDLMVIFLTTPEGREIEPILNAVESEVDSLVWATTDRRADVSFGEVREWRGRPWIEERMGGLTLRFGPNSFFQSNPALATRMYEHVAGFARGEATDLFCGVGGIALFAASRAGTVVGVDNNAESIRFADHNAQTNGVRNARFFLGDARLFLVSHRCETLLLDPPRSGLGPKSIRKILRAAPPRIVYVSCNPKILSGEIPLFAGYSLDSMEAFDLFPRTPHVEVVALFNAVPRSPGPVRPEETAPPAPSSPL